ncbi:MAG: YceI family protein [Paracoccaceae bacterium]
MLNTRETYGLVAQALHWATAALILVLIPMGVIMHNLPDLTEAQASAKFELYSLHKTLGMSVLIIAVLRILWTLTQTHPAPLHPDRRLETLAAKTVHWTLYASIILMPVTGWLHHAALDGFAPIWGPFPQSVDFVPKSPLWADRFGAAHVTVAIMLGVSIALHVAGALKHAIIDRDGTLRRMVPGQGGPDDVPAGHSRDGAIAIVLAALAVVAALAGAAVMTAPMQNDVQTATDSETPVGGWQVDPENSRIEITVTQSGTAVQGSFTVWTAAILFDPDAPEAADITVTIDTGSLSLGGVTDRAKSPEFLDAAMFPQATYTISSATRTGDGQFEAQGDLTLHGVTAPLPLAFDLRIEDDRAFVTGTTQLNRVDYGVGAEAFPNDSIVAFPVDIRITLQADRQ